MCFFFVSLFSQEVRIGNTGAKFRLGTIADSPDTKNEYIVPIQGCRFIIIEVIVDNTKGATTIPVNSSLFLLKDVDGNCYDPHIGIEMSVAIHPSLKSEDLEKGDISRGKIGFEVPSNLPLKSFRIRYVSSEQKSNWLIIK